MPCKRWSHSIKPRKGPDTYIAKKISYISGIYPRDTFNPSINRSYGIHIVWPISKRLMCGDVGAGAMEEPDKIARQVRIALQNPKRELFRGLWWESNRSVILGIGTSIAIVCAMVMLKSRVNL